MRYMHILVALIVISSSFNIKSYGIEVEDYVKFLTSAEIINIHLELIEEGIDVDANSRKVAMLASEIDSILRGIDKKLADELYLNLVDMPVIQEDEVVEHISDTRMLLDKAIASVIPSDARSEELYAQVIFNLLVSAEEEYENGNDKVALEYTSRAYNLYNENIGDDKLNKEFEDMLNLMVNKESLTDISMVNSRLQRDLITLVSDNVEHKAYFNEIRSLYSNLLEAYKNNDYASADEYAIVAYIDNYELLEPSLSKVDNELMEELEVDMRIKLRDMIRERADYEQVERLVNDILVRLDEAERLLDERLVAFENIQPIEIDEPNGDDRRQMGEASEEEKSDVMEQVDAIRLKLLAVLEEYEKGNYDAAYEKARSAYLDNYEFIEVPLQPIDPNFTLESEIKFAELRQLIKERADYDQVKAKVVEIRKMLDESERLVTGTGVIAPAIAFSSSYAIIFREGLESALIVGAIITYLEATRNEKYKRHIYYGVAIALGATAVTWIIASYIIQISGADREVIEAIAALSATAILFYVSFWILNKIETKKWIEFVKAKVWQATTTGSAIVLVSLAFFTVYREGFETVLFYQAMLSFAKYMEWFVMLGFILGLGSLVGVYYVMRRLGRRLPLKILFALTMAIGAYLSIAFIGNGIRELQEAGYMQVTPLFGVIPRLDINLAIMTGIHPTLESIVAQISLLAVYLIGMLYLFIIKPRREKAIIAARRSRSEVEG